LLTVSVPVSLAMGNGDEKAKDPDVEEQEIRRLSEDYPDFCISRLSGPAAAIAPATPEPQPMSHGTSPLASTQVEQVFLAELAQVRAGRAWVRDVLPSACPLRDDCVLVFSELLANAAEHGGGGLVRVWMTHGTGRVRGVLIQRALPAEGPVPEVPLPVFLEIERLLEAPVQRAADVADLAESGRGLAVVAALCPGPLEFERRRDHSVIRWELEGCACTVGTSGASPMETEAGI
jgi:anti-sigma regulatory factor (Ser/Thr protein kinase)